MAKPNWSNRTLFHGDNLDVMRSMNSETVDLIATDPPFNKSRDFHATPDSLSRGASFHDRWSWAEDVHPDWAKEIREDIPELMEAIESARDAHSDAMGAYMCYMAVRLREMRRVLKPTGSIYLHCDPTASHYLKAVMDAIFGWRQFRNEIAWVYGEVARGAKSIARQFARSRDSIFWFSKSGSWTFNPPILERLLTDTEAKRKGYRQDERGWFKTAPRGDYTDESVQRLEAEGRIYRTRTGNIRIRYNLEQRGGRVVDPGRYTSSWMDIPDMMHTKKSERYKYPTQKPLALYDRILATSSVAGDVVLDPFCGCATTLIAAERLGRQWVGIDIWKGARDAVIQRMENEYTTSGQQLTVAGKTPLTLFTESFDFTDRLPHRSDGGLTAGTELPTVMSFGKKPWERISKVQMRLHLLEAQVDPQKEDRYLCAGCGRSLEKEFLDLDHLNPKAGMVSKDTIDNRILLCRPCNLKKRDRYTLNGLWKENKKDKWMHSEQLTKRAVRNVRNRVGQIQHGVISLFVPHPQ